MEQNSKSSSILGRAFAKIGKEAFDEIVNKIDGLKIKGPTLKQYLSEFEEHYAEQFETICNIAHANVGIFKLENAAQPVHVRVVSQFTEYWPVFKKNDNTQNNQTTTESGGFFY